MNSKLKPERKRQRRQPLRAARGYTAAIKKLRKYSNALNRESLEYGRLGQVLMASRKYEQSQAMKYAWLYLENQAAV